LTLLAVFLVAAASTPAFAHSGGGNGGHGGGGQGHSGGHHGNGGHHGHHSGGHGGGIFVVAPAFLDYPPLPYYPWDAIEPPGPLVYIEKDTSTPDLPAGYWYYCAEAHAYYPNVMECAGNWQPVAPLAPSGR
jgi:hypothetical protein